LKPWKGGNYPHKGASIMSGSRTQARCSPVGFGCHLKSATCQLSRVAALDGRLKCSSATRTNRIDEMKSRGKQLQGAARGKILVENVVEKAEKKCTRTKS